RIPPVETGGSFNSNLVRTRPTSEIPPAGENVWKRLPVFVRRDAVNSAQDFKCRVRRVPPTSSRQNVCRISASVVPQLRCRSPRERRYEFSPVFQGRGLAFRAIRLVAVSDG